MRWNQINWTWTWTWKNVKSRSKIAPFFSNECHFEIWFPKKKTITFFWSKLSKLHKKDPNLHVTTTFSLKQGETRTNSVPIPHPLTETWLHDNENVIISESTPPGYSFLNISCPANAHGGGYSCHFQNPTELVSKEILKCHHASSLNQHA